MPLKLITAGGGSVILDANSTASTYTVNVPAQGGAMLTSASGLNATNMTSGTLPTARLPSGSVLQVVSAVSTSLVTTTSGSYVSTGFSASITPTSSSSKILILLNASMQGSGNGGFGFNLYRGGSSILVDGQPYSAAYWVYGNNWRTKTPLMYLDSPATTSSTTYTLYYASYNGITVYLCTENSPSTMTLLEIAA